jgi:hypothetical protein
MAVDTFTCPECQAKLRRSPHLRPGALVQCPKCHLQFPVPPEEEEPASPPPEPARRAPGPSDAYGETPAPAARREERLATGAEPRRRREEEDEDYPRAGGRRGDSEQLSSGYEIDLGQWFRVGAQHWSAVLGPFIGYLLLLLLITLVLLVLIVVGWIAMIFVLPPLGAGFTIVALAQLKGEPWTFSDFFGGFKWYGSILGVTMIILLISLACMLPVIIAYVVIIAAAQARGGPPGPEILVVIPGYLVSIPAMTFFQVRFLYAIPLIIDRNFGAMEALRGSWKLTQGHFWMTFLVWFLLQLINQAGAAACYIGMLFTFPLVILVPTAGYLLIAGTRPPVSPQGSSEAPAPRRRPEREEEY